ncbi:pyridoxamine 5'-phosphate oxidase [Desulfogranum mediterraneum]|uniref:pyridoxamine 5'-phosphate oxidase n=1 Tax=Desulfogranum mediterraneum TaxID=160661 RepID=UPI00040D60EE|nr:pyridoxamine 5'-phosphate oxidase [Desulfogranum mediterraneum]
MDIKGLRKDYQSPVIYKDMLDHDPFKQFAVWFKEACERKITEPNAMSLATATPDGQPSQRTVLLKIFDGEGFVFFTNYASAKARQIQANPQVSLLFPWIEMERQVSITGTAAKISTMESAKYFASRPRESQLGAWISNQSSLLSSRNLLMVELEKVKSKFLDGKIPLPDFWGGYRVIPETMEFWQGRSSRLHDRFLYTRKEESWTIERLAP